MSKNHSRASQNAALQRQKEKEIKKAMSAGQADMVLCLLSSLTGFFIGLFFLYKLYNYTLIAISAFGLDVFAILIYTIDKINQWLKIKKRKREIRYIIKLFALFFSFTFVGWGGKIF